MQPKGSVKKENSITYSILYILVDFAFFGGGEGGCTQHFP